MGYHKIARSRPYDGQEKVNNPQTMGARSDIQGKEETCARPNNTQTHHNHPSVFPNIRTHSIHEEINTSYETLEENKTNTLKKTICIVDRKAKIVTDALGPT